MEPEAPAFPRVRGFPLGGFNISCLQSGCDGYRTPNIDRIAKDGSVFTDWHGPINSWRPAITCGQASTGQSQHSEFALTIIA